MPPFMEAYARLIPGLLSFFYLLAARSACGGRAISAGFVSGAVGEARERLSRMRWNDASLTRAGGALSSSDRSEDAAEGLSKKVVRRI